MADECEIEFVEDGELTKYSYTANGVLFEYFVASEITKLLGYKNTAEGIKNISNCNKIEFRDYQGVKIPKLDPRTILITRSGIEEILLKTRKYVPLHIVQKINKETMNKNYVTKEHIEVELEEDDFELEEADFELEADVEEDELTMYSYISNHLCFEYFVGYEIATLLGYANTTKVIINNVSKCNQLVFKNYPGVKIPELQHNTILISRDGAVELLIKTRKRISPDVLHILKKFNIHTTNRKCLTKEQQTLSALTNAFKTEKFEDQYKIGKYYLDLYFPDYKIVIECDENGHADRKPWKERERMDFVNKKLEITDDNWIRYNPDSEDFDISKVIGKIYIKINLFKELLYSKHTEKEEKHIEKGKEDDVFELQIEPITCKFTAPPKEFLLEKLKTHNITDIARMYGISNNPVSKWLKTHDIDIKTIKANLEPTKDELIEHFKDKNQTEVSKFYNVSNHIVRTWVKKHNLDLKTIKVKPILKEDLLKLVNDYTEEEIAKKLNITMLALKKHMKIHSIEKIPSKDELEILVNSKTKDDIAKIYDVNRATLRKWLKSYDLEGIRFSNYSRPITATKDKITKRYASIVELCKDLHISHNKVDDYVDTDEAYNGYVFAFV
jgi:transposase/very-short-patch-repair endonuclease/prophage antirepressor-like protein